MTNESYQETLDNVDKHVVTTIRTLIGLSGLVALIVGVLILVWPVKTAVVVAGLVAVYLFIVGVVSIAIGVFSAKARGWARVGYIVLGLIFLIAGVVALVNLGAATAVLAVVLGIVVGVAWIVEGVVGLSMIGDSSSKGWTIFYGLLSIIAGIILLFSPMWGAAVLWLLIGISLAVLGVVQIIRAFRFGKNRLSRA